MKPLIFSISVFLISCSFFFLGMMTGVPAASQPPWISALTSIAAVTISALAVYLVHKTLVATREALDATRDMSAEQKRIGDTQIRAWLHVSEAVFRNEFDSEIVIRIKNYGATPVDSCFVEIDKSSYYSGLPIMQLQHKLAADSLILEESFPEEAEHYYLENIAPGQEISILADVYSCMANSRILIMDVKISYQSIGKNIQKTFSIGCDVRDGKK